MPLANYTTTVPANRSVGWIQEILAAAGAKAIMLDYENGEPCSVTFRIDEGEKQFGYRLPADWRKTLVVLKKPKSKVPYKYQNEIHAKRVAWRCIHDWLRAQLALVEIDSAELKQVMLAYAITSTGRTLYEVLKEGNFHQLQLTN